MWSFGSYVELNGQSIHLGSPQPEEYQGDKSDFPRFAESQPAVANSLGAALFDLAALLLWNLLFAISAFYTFSRSDVR
jgi:hypothetical protein